MKARLRESSVPESVGRNIPDCKQDNDDAPRTALYATLRATYKTASGRLTPLTAFAGA